MTTRPCHWRTQPLERGFLVARLERARRRGPRSFARRHDTAERAAATPSRKNAVSATGSTSSPGAALREIAGPEVAANDAERDERDRIAGGYADSAAGHADHAAFECAQNRSRRRVMPSVRSKANCAAPANDRKRLRRKYEQPAGEQRDQRQHVEVDAIGARNPLGRARRRFRPIDCDTRRQRCGDLRRLHPIGPGSQTQVDRVSTPPSERVLYGRDVYDGERLARDVRA